MASVCNEKSFSKVLGKKRESKIKVSRALKRGKCSLRKAIENLFRCLSIRSNITIIGELES